MFVLRDGALRTPSEVAPDGSHSPTPMDDAELDASLSRADLKKVTSKTLTDHAALRREVERVRLQAAARSEPAADELTGIPAADELTAV